MAHGCRDLRPGRGGKILFGARELYHWVQTAQGSNPGSAQAQQYKPWPRDSKDLASLFPSEKWGRTVTVTSWGIMNTYEDQVHKISIDRRSL